MSKNGFEASQRERTAHAGAVPQAANLAGSAEAGSERENSPVRATLPANNMTDSAETRPGANRKSDGVCVDAVDVVGLCGPGLRARLGEIARAESRLAVMKADALGEIARRSGDGAAAHAAVNEMAVSGRKARGEVREAVRLGELDATRAGLAAGTVPGRATPDQITYHKNNNGTGASELALAGRAYALARAAGRGIEIDLEPALA